MSENVKKSTSLLPKIIDRVVFMKKKRHKDKELNKQKSTLYGHIGKIVFVQIETETSNRRFILSTHPTEQAAETEARIKSGLREFVQKKQAGKSNYFAMENKIFKICKIKSQERILLHTICKDEDEAKIEVSKLNS